MPSSRHVTVRVDLARVRANAAAVRQAAGVPLIAVVKADAYGLGGAAVAKAVAELVDAFYVFDVAEAVAYGLRWTGKRTIAVHGEGVHADDHRELNVRPAVWSVEAAARLAPARPVLSVDTGQQRFGVPVGDAATIDAILRAGRIDEAYTHASTAAQAAAFAAALRGTVRTLHAAGSALLGDPAARLDAVRPGLALYRGAVRVSAPLVEATDTVGPAGYTGFRAARHGVLLAGYSNGLAAGPCAVNGRRTVLPEVGMQSAFVDLAPGDRPGDEVVLLGDGITEDDLARAWRTTPHEALIRACGMGRRSYVGFDLE
ncbi:MAG TPA: alanine racemase [Humisphaera sp.]